MTTFAEQIVLDRDNVLLNTAEFGEVLTYEFASGGAVSMTSVVDRRYTENKREDNRELTTEFVDLWLPRTLFIDPTQQPQFQDTVSLNDGAQTKKYVYHELRDADATKVHATFKRVTVRFFGRPEKD